jgi:5-oxoprolinase (ATP-hydrolysing) subunit A
MTCIDINCDMGEFPEAVADGTQESLMPHLTSVNIACGGHAGNRDTMRTTIAQAVSYKLALGAHPGYPDPANFGRVELDIPLSKVADGVARQVAELASIASESGARLTHVKPHGALYNQAAKNRKLAGAIADGVAQVDRRLILMGLAGSPMLDEFRDAGFAVAAEAFADRTYQPDGSLRPRRFSDALIRDPQRAAAQALRIAQLGLVTAFNGSDMAIDAQTICIHGDTPGAPLIAEAVAKELVNHGVKLAPIR